MQVWLLDSEPIYTRQLSSRIHRELHGLDVRIAASMSHLEQMVRERCDPLVLLIASQTDFPDLDKATVREVGSDSLPAIDIWFLVDTDRELPDHHYLPRLAPVHHLISRIREWADDKGKASGTSYHLHFIFRPDGQCDEDVRQLLHRLVGQGLRLIYLPLMPTTQMRLVGSPTDGPRLSTLLLQLTGSPDHIVPLSPCWQPNRSGWLEFRPPERSDDLASCDALTLRLLISRLRNTLSEQGDSTCAIVDCLSIPFIAALAAASQCDSYQVCSKSRTDFTDQSIAAETREFQRKLPARCQRFESDDDLISALAPLLLRSAGSS